MVFMRRVSGRERKEGLWESIDDRVALYFNYDCKEGQPGRGSGLLSYRSGN